MLTICFYTQIFFIYIIAFCEPGQKYEFYLPYTQARATHKLNCLASASKFSFTFIFTATRVCVVLPSPPPPIAEKQNKLPGNKNLSFFHSLYYLTLYIYMYLCGNVLWMRESGVHNKNDHFITRLCIDFSLYAAHKTNALYVCVCVCV